MQADLSRTTFDAAKHFSAVLSQQGRVQLDADGNEQAAILLHQLRTVVADLIGPAGAPVAGAGFAIDPVAPEGKVTDLGISAGRMYVDGILVENEEPTTYWTQPDGYLEQDATADRLPSAFPYVVYLRVWERLITAVQDPAIREIALGDPGPDTAARAKVIWQVATLPLKTGEVPAEAFEKFLTSLNPDQGTLTAQALRPRESDKEPCHLPPEARFRGPENQLYRVEVHVGGRAWREGVGVGAADIEAFGSGATFKWSRENASVVFPVVSVSEAVVKVTTLGRDGKLALEVGDWVELVDDASASRVADDRPVDPKKPVPALRRVVAIDPADRLVTLDGPVDGDGCGPGTRPERHPMLRRWDHGATATTDKRQLEVGPDGVPLVEGEWIDLEDGVQVRFDRPAGSTYGTYRRADYWQIPARTISGDVVWPKDGNAPAAKLPDGVRYSYAPLALVDKAGPATPMFPTFEPITTKEAPAPAEAATAKRPAARQQPKPRTAESTRRPSGSE